MRCFNKIWNGDFLTQSLDVTQSQSRFTQSRHSHTVTQSRLSLHSVIHPIILKSKHTSHLAPTYVTLTPIHTAHTLSHINGALLAEVRKESFLPRWARPANTQWSVLTGGRAVFVVLYPWSSVAASGRSQQLPRAATAQSRGHARAVSAVAVSRPLSRDLAVAADPPDDAAATVPRYRLPSCLIVWRQIVSPPPINQGWSTRVNVTTDD